METNATEAVKNNVLGTLALGEAAGESGVEAFILVSTDKAVRPTSVMGATKRVAELVVQDLGRRFPTRYVAVRFGNVLGSAGSDTRRMIELSGHRRSGDVDIVFTGLRPGEKLFEELEYGDEATDRTRHPKILVGKIAGAPASELSAALSSLRALASKLPRSGRGVLRSCHRRRLPPQPIAVPGAARHSRRSGPSARCAGHGDDRTLGQLRAHRQREGQRGGTGERARRAGR
jgi:FlaA1/EpsC-like NDP-sugar epimerase